MADNEDDILSIETILKRPKIKIDGALYEIIAPGELSLEQNYRLSELGQKLANMRNTRGLKHAQRAQMAETLTQICKIILEPVPAAVQATLTDANKLAVIEVFTLLLSTEKARLAGETLTKLAKPLLGEKLFPGFNTSTAETPKAG